MPKIKITLKSDLCSGSGQGFSGTIDTDICHDKYGLPYIPARRLKGVLLDAAKYIGTCCKTKNEIFGETGKNQSGSLRLRNARVDEYEKLCEDLKNNDLDSQKILALFTDTKAQTAIVNDTADENSLRFTRTVNQYSPLDGSEMCFFADCEVGEQHIEEFKEICKAVRNIGLERTRGLGAVHLEFLEDKKEHEKSEEEKNKIKEEQEKQEEEINSLEDSQKYCLNYDIILDSPLMLPSVSNGETMEYISGTAILGALAAEYLKTNKNDDDFEDLFLKENVVIGNAYWQCSIPAPLFVQKIKETGKIRTVFSKEESDGTPKPLKDAFIHPTLFKKFDIETEISYHHSRGDDSTLYTQKHLSAGQKFKGEIIGEGRYVKKIWKLLLSPIKLGRSKSAEYSECLIKNIAANSNKKEMELKNGATYVLALESDFVALDKCGNYAAKADVILEAAGITGDIKNDKSCITIRRNAGYYTVWNLKKPHFTAVKAGSYITFEYMGDNKTIDFMEYYGEKNNEGFGKIRLYEFSTLENFKYEDKICDPKPDANILSEQYKELENKIAENEKIENIRLAAIEFANKQRKKLIGLNAAFVGRVALMVNQSDDFDDLQKRIDSIKSEGKQKDIKDIIGAVEKEPNWQEYLKIVFTLAKYWLKNDEGKGDITE